MNLMYESELYHHGIKGMKWGVRRYQNYDGSYTKRGLERYNRAFADYENARNTRKSSKDQYKSGRISKSKYKESINTEKKAKRTLNATYDRLKTDRLADEGKKLYKRGKTITGNTQKTSFTQGAVAIGAFAANRIIAQNFNDTPVNRMTRSAIAIGGIVANSMMGVKVMKENKALRAYYAH